MCFFIEWTVSSETYCLHVDIVMKKKVYSWKSHFPSYNLIGFLLQYNSFFYFCGRNSLKVCLTKEDKIKWRFIEVFLNLATSYRVDLSLKRNLRELKHSQISMHPFFHVLTLEAPEIKCGVCLVYPFLLSLNPWWEKYSSTVLCIL